MRYYLSTLHWLDAMNQDMSVSIDALLDYVKGILSHETDGNKQNLSARKNNKKKNNKIKMIVITTVSIAVVASVAVVLIVMLLNKAPAGRDVIQSSVSEKTSAVSEKTSSVDNKAAESYDPNDKKVENDYLYSEHENRVSLDLYFGSEEETIIVPTTINGLPVTEISEECFLNQDYIKKAVIPEGVEKIGLRAFKGCANLREVSLPSTLKKISPEAFRGTALIDPELPGDLQELGHSVFYDCKNLKSLVVPSGVHKIDSDTFRYCSALESVTIQSPDIQISAEAFSPENDVTLIGVKGSYTEKYAKGMDMKFEEYKP